MKTFYINMELKGPCEVVVNFETKYIQGTSSGPKKV